MIQAARKEGYRNGWNDRKEFDSDLIEDVLRQSGNFKEFTPVLREKIAKEEDGVE